VDHLHHIDVCSFYFSCNDNIKGVGNLSSPGSSEINVMSLFNTNPRAKRSHGHKIIQHPNIKKASKPRTLQDTFNDLPFTTSFLLRMLLMLIASIPLLANGLWRNFLLLS
jgi:hypothetical protein